MDKVTVAAIITGILAVSLILIGAIAPYIQVPSQIYRIGPSPLLNSSNAPYTTETFEIPPLRANQLITLIATKSPEGNLTIQLVNNNPEIKGIPEAFLFPMYDGNTSISYRLLIYQPGSYVVIVTSYHSTYTLYLSGVWASLYQLKPLLEWGMLFMIAFIALLYYRRVLSYKRTIYSVGSDESSGE